MAEERRRRKRGRRRGRGDRHPEGQPPEQRPEESPPEVTEESEAPGVLPSLPRFRFGRRRDSDEEKTEERRRKDREERAATGGHADVSPLAFWRRGRSRTYREQPMPKQTLGRTLRRVRGMYFPPWVPVAFIILVVFGILGLLFFAQGAAGKPRINDHWHATYQILICGQRQPNAPSWPSGVGVHTHNDGVIHMHPSSPAGEGAGARLVKWFEYGGGKLTQSEMRIPGSREEYKNGDTCDDGSEAVLQLFVNGEKLSNWKRFNPQDGDRVRIIFGPDQATEDVEEAASTPIPQSEATRTVDLEVTDTGGDESTTTFEPASIDLRPGETVMLAVKNTGEISHMIRVAGPDGEFDTSDDFVAATADGAEILESGEEGAVVIRFDEEGEFEFKDPTVLPEAGGTLVVAGEPFDEATEAEPVDVTLSVTMDDSFFEPIELEVKAGERFRIELTNKGEFVHNLRIAGPDGAYRTEDDLVSTPETPEAGQGGKLVGQIDEPGVYEFRSDFPPSGEMTGTITVTKE